jgi:hypothetical protein
MVLSDLIVSGTDLETLARKLEVPTVAGLQHQGDVSVIPAAMVDDYHAPRTPVPTTGVAVLGGDATGNTHLLLASGRVLFDPYPAMQTLTLGSLHVTEQATAYLDHPEHGNSGIAPGRYVLRRKREQADELRMVTD